MKPSPLVSVVVPTCNRAAFLPRLLAALDAQTYPHYDIVVVDDASTDDTPAILHAWAGQGRRVITLSRASGSYAARNAGWKAAQGEIIAFTDDDCLPDAGWLTALVEALNGKPPVGVQGMTLAHPGEITPFTHQIDQRAAGAPYRTCNIAYRRTTLETLGGFDDSLRWYADNILGLRARQLGPIAFAPDAVVLHPPRPREWRSRAEWRARFAADRKHRQVLHELGVEPLVVPGRALPIVLWIIRPLVKQGMRHLVYMARHPGLYLRGIVPMLGEKRHLLAALCEPDRPSPRFPALPDQLLVSVIVVTRRRPQLLADALEALRHQTYGRREIIVVDHGGDERTREVVEDAGARYIRVESGTLGEARQRGVDAARGVIVAFTDDDCLPAPSWLESLLQAFRSHPGWAGVQGRTEAERGAARDRAVQVLSPSSLYHTCNIAYRRDALIRAGGFDTRFAGWFEDTALGARIQRVGEIGFAPEAIVAHRAVPRAKMTVATWQALLADEYLLSREYHDFYRRNRGPGFLPVVLARWTIGSPIKTMMRAWPGALADPRGYLMLVVQLVQERIDLLRVLPGFLSSRRSC